MKVVVDVSEKRERLVEKLGREKGKYMKHNSDWTDSYQKLVTESAAKENALQFEVQTLKQMVDLEKLRKSTLNAKYTEMKQNADDLSEKYKQKKTDLKTMKKEHTDMTEKLKE